jgi:hypothetical protein
LERPASHPELGRGKLKRYFWLTAGEQLQLTHLRLELLRRACGPDARRCLYAHFDGLGLDLKLNSHENECVVYLEPEVMQNLIEFWKAIVEDK